MREGKLNEMGNHVPDRLLEEMAVFGAPGEIGALLRARYDGVLDRISLYSTMGGDGNLSRWPELVSRVNAAYTPPASGGAHGPVAQDAKHGVHLVSI
jgi:hypothetical protein